MSCVLGSGRIQAPTTCIQMWHNLRFEILWYQKIDHNHKIKIFFAGPYTLMNPKDKNIHIALFFIFVPHQILPTYILMRTGADLLHVPNTWLMLVIYTRYLLSLAPSLCQACQCMFLHSLEIGALLLVFIKNIGTAIYSGYGNFHVFFSTFYL